MTIASDVSLNRNPPNIAMTELQEFLTGVVWSLPAVTLALMSPGPNIMAVIGTPMG